jgi:hypothetical protein
MEDRRDAHRVFLWGGGGDLRERYHLEEIAVDGTETDLQEMGWGGMNWNDLVRDRDMGRALVNSTINFRVP